MKKLFMFLSVVCFSFSANADFYSEFHDKLLEEYIKVHQSPKEEIKYPVATKGTPLWPGEKSDRVMQLQDRLNELGFTVPKNGAFDKKTHAAVVQFQKSRGLEPSGIVGPATKWQLNFSREDKLSALADAMARVAHVTDFNKMIIVNIPSYELFAIKSSKVELTSKVIVGKSGTSSGGATPLMTTMLTGLVYNPAWTPTPQISEKKIMPKWIKDPEYLNKKNIRVLDSDRNIIIGATPEEFKERGYKFWQPPGDDNALGVLKFVLDNKLNIYMHDTNDRTLFNSRQRDYSSGCIRVESWMELAKWTTGFSEEHLKKRIESKATTGERTEKIWVQLTYWLVTFDGDRAIYHHDIYDQMSRSVSVRTTSSGNTDLIRK